NAVGTTSLDPEGRARPGFGPVGCGRRGSASCMCLRVPRRRASRIDVAGLNAAETTFSPCFVSATLVSPTALAPVLARAECSGDYMLQAVGRGPTGRLSATR